MIIFHHFKECKNFQLSWLYLKFYKRLVSHSFPEDSSAHIVVEGEKQMIIFLKNGTGWEIRKKDAKAILMKYVMRWER